MSNLSRLGYWKVSDARPLVRERARISNEGTSSPARAKSETTIGPDHVREVSLTRTSRGHRAPSRAL